MEAPVFPLLDAAFKQAVGKRNCRKWSLVSVPGKHLHLVSGQLDGPGPQRHLLAQKSPSGWGTIPAPHPTPAPVCGSLRRPCYPQPSGPLSAKGAGDLHPPGPVPSSAPRPPSPVSLEVEQMSTRAAQGPGGQSASAKWVSGLAGSGTRALCQPVGTGLLVASLLLPAKPRGHGTTKTQRSRVPLPAPPWRWALCSWPAVPGRWAAHLRPPSRVTGRPGASLWAGPAPSRPAARGKSMGDITGLPTRRTAQGRSPGCEFKRVPGGPSPPLGAPPIEGPRSSRWRWRWERQVSPDPGPGRGSVQRRLLLPHPRR